ncbi:MAG: class I tRNA ligase family protein [Candidatus Nanopelagicales bacterium]
MTHDLVPPSPLRLGGQRLALVGPARVYVCGVTPYDVTHLGHAATFVWVDAVTRVLRQVGIEVTLTRNVTDVDDVLTAAARRAGTPYDQFAAIQQYQFDHDMSSLHVRRPDHEPRAHRHVRDVVRLAQALLDAGHAYEREGTVWFRGAGVAERAGLDRAAALSACAQFGETPDDPRKEDPLDVPVWRASGPDDPAWPSPWGSGRPGWHAECTAMVLSTYGPSIDLHAGGADLAFPHHAYEAAQAEAATGVVPFARSWMHVGTVLVDGVKMAKSTGNLVLVADLLERHRAAAVRLMLLDRPWAGSWDYAPEVADAAEARLDELYAAAGRPSGSHAAEHAVVDALLDDLDVPRALDLAVAEGGPAARLLTQVLALA